MAACIITALLGIATVCWYAMGEQLQEDELEEEVQAEISKKGQKASTASQVRGLFKRVK